LDLRELTKGLPKTDLLYWKDSYARSFESNVVRVARDGQRKAYMITRASAFHPKGGGQPSDTGTIATKSGVGLVVKKVMIVDGVIAHYGEVTEGASDQLQVGLNVHGEIDWNERYAAMRKHTAGHLLDHCLETATGRPSKTVDSWLGEPSYVTYAGEAPDKNQLRRARELEIEGIMKALPVRVDFVSYEKMLKIAGDAPNIERLPKSDLMRIVTIEGYKPIPCGGTHVKNTSEIGEFELLNVETVEDGKGFKVYYTAK